MSTRRYFRAMTRQAEPALSGAALMHCTVHCTILGGLLLLSAP
jgi:hypothetical protein